MARKQVLTVIDLRSGAQVGKSIKVSTPSLWARSDTELKAAIKTAGNKPPPVTRNYTKIKSDCTAIGWAHIGFTREWED